MSDYKLVLIRNYTYTQHGTFGRLHIYKGDKYLKFLCDTLEPPLNSPMCVNHGVYGLTMTYSPKFGISLPLLTGLNRVGIRIHAGNNVRHTAGCILVGLRHDFTLTCSKATLNEVIDAIRIYHIDEIDIRVCCSLDLFE